MGDRRGIIIHPQELDETWPERLQDAGINVLGLHPVGGTTAFASLEEAIQQHNLPKRQSIIARLNHMGIAVEYEAHTMSWLLPRGLFSIVPEWFRMNENGERVADVNLCATNEDALAYIEQRSEMLARFLHTGSNRYYFWMDDVADGGCHCARCQQYSDSDQQLMVVNAMVRGIRRFDSTAKVSYLAYYHTVSAPKKIAPLNGVFLEYAPFQRDHHQPMFDPSCPQNAEETAPVEALLACFGQADSQVLEYWMDNSKFSGWTKPPKQFTLDEAVMRRDVADYRARGFAGITSFGCYLGADYRDLYGEPPVLAYGKILRGEAE